MFPYTQNTALINNQGKRSLWDHNIASVYYLGFFIISCVCVCVDVFVSDFVCVSLCLSVSLSLDITY